MVDQTSQFYAILTNVGAAKQANADALGIAWKITQMGVGDANNTDPTPNANQTSLINEWRRAPLNQLKVDDKDAAIIVAEQVIPAEVGGRWIREIGLYDADGDLVAVANCPPTYKPQLSQGSGRTQVVRMNLIVSSSSNVELKIDPSVVLATREWVTSELHKQDFKHSVLAATTANIALTGLQTIDGVALTAGARVLVKNQAAGKDNGLYTVAAGAWTRCPDADVSTEVTPGLLVLVERGTVNGDSAWQLVTDAPISLGVSALVFEMAFGRTGVAENTYRSVTVDKYGRVVAASNPTTVAAYGLTDVYTKTQVDQALVLKAPLASPALTGAPTAPTAAVGANNTQLATTAFVQAAIAALVASSPGALDTLNELAAALGNDPNFATTMTNALALKAPLASPTFTGDPKAPTAPATDKDTTLATTAFVRAAMALFGVGATANQFGGNIDTLVETGFYLVSANAGTMPKWPEGYPGGVAGQPITAGSLLHIERGSGSAATQIFDAFVNTDVAVTMIRSKKLGGTWLPWREIWSSENTPKMDSLTDATVGRMVTVGAHGVGRGILSEENDLNNYTTPGNYLTGQFLVNLPVGWASSGRRYTLVVEGLSSSGHLTQRLISGMSGEGVVVAVRSYSASKVWSEWDIQVSETNHVASQPEVDAGVNDKKYVTPKKLRMGISFSLGKNGYVALPSWLGGIVLQWGEGTASGFSNAFDLTGVVSYPIAFPSAVYSFIGLCHPTTAAPAVRSYQTFLRTSTANPLGSLVSMMISVINVQGNWQSGDSVRFSWFAVGK
ncbi:phage tail protein [Pseudomonas juntendi]|uniref:phage tail-collar fiber domain-containing protein n=1 Tax=Pseudomonas juntendi TaxID=2666183 RepID=UPI0034D77DD0